MKLRLNLLVTLSGMTLFSPGWASDACSGRAIVTAAAVQVSDGSSFETVSYFQSPNTAAIRHIQEDIQTVAVEGPVAWVGRGDKVEAGGDRLRSFALGHQFHAMLLHFDEMATDIVSSTEIPFAGGRHHGRGGDFIYGGKITLVSGGENQKPLGLLFELPEQPPMEITFSGWETRGASSLPYHVSIDDGSRVFDYAYSEVTLESKSPDWFYEVVPAPAMDKLEIYRLHRRLLAAHCQGSADTIANLTTLESIVSGRGTLNMVSREETRSRFEQVFERLDYTNYHDLTDPVIEVSPQDGIGWIGVEVRAVGTEIGSARPFSSQWSWVMLTRKVDGRWLNAGNASSHLPTPVEKD